MKYAILTAGLVMSAIVASGPALSADMPLKAPYAAPAGYDWSGTYIGGILGGGWATNDVSDPGLGIVGALLGVPVVQTTKSNGFIGGAEVGTNYQIGKLVVGLEADWTGGDIKGTSSSNFAAGLINRSIGANTTWTGTVATRIGIAHDNWLVYGKAGSAFEHTNFTDNWTAVGLPLFSGTGSSTRTGWMTGAGVEWAFASNWSVKAEYNYLDFGTHAETINGTLVGVVPASFGIQNEQHINQVKVGLNWRFLPNVW
jgi:outer membrane immunogenic protein